MGENYLRESIMLQESLAILQSNMMVFHVIVDAVAVLNDTPLPLL